MKLRPSFWPKNPETIASEVLKEIEFFNSEKHSASSNLCEEVFSSATERAEELEHNIDVTLQDQDVRQRHHPGARVNRTAMKCVMSSPLAEVLRTSSI